MESSRDTGARVLEVQAARTPEAGLSANGSGTGVPAPFPSLGGMYSIPVRTQGGIHHGLVGTGSTQTLLHQSSHGGYTHPVGAIKLLENDFPGGSL